MTTPWRKRAYRDLPTLDRIRLRVVETPDGCWEWQGGVMNNGYPGIQHDGRTQLVHRVAYELLVGPIPDGMQIDHLCRNRRCSCPAHLEPVPQAENIRRSDSWSAISRRIGECRRGHTFSASNTYVDKRGKRHCRACRQIREAGTSRAKRHVAAALNRRKDTT